jgi:hypothetical protein
VAYRIPIEDDAKLSEDLAKGSNDTENADMTAVKAAADDSSGTDSA